MLQRAEFFVQFDHILFYGQKLFINGAGRSMVLMLCEIADIGVLLFVDLPFVGCHLIHDDLEQGGLSGAV